MQNRKLKNSVVALAIGLIGSAAWSATGAKPISEAATPAAKVTLSSAKTVRELVEIDDRLAIKKEQNALLAEQAKSSDIDPRIQKSADLSKSLQFERDNAAAEKKSAEIAASNIVVTSIMGVEGSRVVDGTIGGKPFHAFEGKATELGWTLISVRGLCTEFEKTSISQPVKHAKKSNSKVDLLKSAKPVNGDRKTACFTQMRPQPLTYGPSGVRIPIPMPMSKSPIPMPVGLQ